MEAIVSANPILNPSNFSLPQKQKRSAMILQRLASQLKNVGKCRVRAAKLVRYTAVRSFLICGTDCFRINAYAFSYFVGIVMASLAGFSFQRND